MKNKIFFVALTVLVAAIPFVFNIYYTTPDDPRYIGLVSGAYTGTPMKELIYVGTILGGIEAFLYSHFSALEWYSIIYYLLTLCSFCTLLAITLNKDKGRLEKYSLIILLFVSQIYLSLTPQFTTLATQLGFTSLVCVLRSNKSRSWAIVGLVFFFFATQMRFVAAFIPYMVACPLFIRTIKLSDKQWWKERVWLLGIIAVAAFTFTADKIAYRDPQWSEFDKANDARAYIADNPIAGDFKNELKDTKEAIAYDLLYSYRVFDTNITPPEKLIEYQQVFKGRALQTIRHNILPYIYGYKALGCWIYIIVLVVLVVDLLRHRKWWALCLLWAILTMFALANLQMMSYSFPKERVMLCTYVALVFATLYIANEYSKYSQQIILVTIAVVGLQYLKRDFYEVRQSLSERTIVQETEQMIQSAGDSKVMLLVPTYLTPEAFQTSSSPIYTKSVIQGWLHFYPATEKKYQPFTTFTDGLPLLVQKESVEQLALICKLLKLEYNKDANISIIKESEHYQLVNLIEER